MVMARGKEIQGPLWTTAMKALLCLARPCLEMAGFVLGDILSGRFLLLVLYVFSW